MSVKVYLTVAISVGVVLITALYFFGQFSDYGVDPFRECVVLGSHIHTCGQAGQP